MTTAKTTPAVTVTGLANIGDLIATAPEVLAVPVPAPAPRTAPVSAPVVPPVQSVADYTSAMQERTEAICQAYIEHRLAGGKKKEYLATLSKEDRNLFKALNLDKLAKLAIAEHIASNPDDVEAKTVYEAMVAKETERLAHLAEVTGANLPGNPEFGKPAKGNKEGKSGKKGKKRYGFGPSGVGVGSPEWLKYFREAIDEQNKKH